MDCVCSPDWINQQLVEHLQAAPAVPTTLQTAAATPLQQSPAPAFQPRARPRSNSNTASTSNKLAVSSTSNTVSTSGKISLCSSSSLSTGAGGDYRPFVRLLLDDVGDRDDEQ